MITTTLAAFIIFFLVVLVLVLVLLVNLWLRSRQKWTSSPSPSASVNEKTPLLRYNTVSVSHQQNEKTAAQDEEEANIVPLPDFDWKTTEPLKFRPFKPRYHITMGIAHLSCLPCVPHAFLLSSLCPIPSYSLPSIQCG